MRARYLDNQFLIDEYSGSFPDCYARKDGKYIGIEYKARACYFDLRNQRTFDIIKTLAWLSG